MRITSLILYQHLFGFNKGLMFADEWHWRNGVRSNGPLHPSGIESALVIVSISRKGRYQLPPPLWPSLRSTQHLATVETFSCLGPLRPSGRSASYHWISQLSDSPSITVRSWMIVKETDFCFSSISLEFLPLLYIRFLLSSLLLPSFCLFLRRKSNKWSTNFDGFSTTERNGDNYPSKTVTVDL